MLQLVEQLDKLDSTISTSDDEIVIEGFMDRYSVSYKEAVDILRETKKFLTLAAESQDKGGISLSIDQPLLIIDEMWHTFILHTKQYVNFCLKTFNRFIHHKPTSKAEKEAIQQSLKENPSLIIEQTKEKMTQQYSLIYDKYGPDTLIKWYDEWATKYTPDYIDKIKKAS